MLRTLIRLYKFDGLTHLATPLGKLLGPLLVQTAACVPAAELHVIPVPLFRGRRSFNQSALLTETAVRQAARHTSLRLIRSDAALQRTRATRSQSQLSRRQRRENVRGAFVAMVDVTGWHVVLIDDVYTSGETAKECTRTLLRAGAVAVHVITLARAQPDHVAHWDAGLLLSSRNETDNVTNDNQEGRGR